MAPDVWIKRAGYTLAGEAAGSLAQRWGIAMTSIYRPLKERTLPSGEMMVRFFVESGGKVGLADWLKYSKVDLTKLGLKRAKEKKNGRH